MNAESQIAIVIAEARRICLEKGAKSPECTLAWDQVLAVTEKIVAEQQAQLAEQRQKRVS